MDRAQLCRTGRSELVVDIPTYLAFYKHVEHPADYLGIHGTDIRIRCDRYTKYLLNTGVLGSMER